MRLDIHSFYAALMCRHVDHPSRRNTEILRPTFNRYCGKLFSGSVKDRQSVSIGNPELISATTRNTTADHCDRHATDRTVCMNRVFYRTASWIKRTYDICITARDIEHICAG